MTGLRLLREAKLEKGTRVILRADLDVKMDKGRIVDDMRLLGDLDTIKELLKAHAKVRIIGYLGRPKGKRSRKFTLLPVARFLRRRLKRQILFIRDPLSPEDFRRYSDSEHIILFENIRFYPEERKNDFAFARKLSRWGEIYVNDAFANSHRKESSVAALARILPSFAGLHLEKEVRVLDRVLRNPQKPLVVVIGGAKLETKLPVVKGFLESASAILVGGAVANELLREGSLRLNKKIILPCDGIGSPQGDFVEIGPKTIQIFVSWLRKAKTIVWNGPLGKSEIPALSLSTKTIARAIARSSAFTVVGGGDTIASLRKYNLLRGFDHVSTGGGAMLEFLAGKKLPGIEVLKK